MSTNVSAVRETGCTDAKEIILCTLGLAAVLAAVGGTAIPTDIIRFESQIAALPIVSHDLVRINGRIMRTEAGESGSGRQREADVA